MVTRKVVKVVVGPFCVVRAAVGVKMVVVVVVVVAEHLVYVNTC